MAKEANGIIGEGERESTIVRELKLILAKAMETGDELLVEAIEAAITKAIETEKASSAGCEGDDVTGEEQSTDLEVSVSLLS
jgi:hypothetical protein